MGPFDRWPTGYGFDYFYGFMAGETSQWEPRLFENTTPVEPPHDPGEDRLHGGMGLRRGRGRIGVLRWSRRPLIEKFGDRRIGRGRSLGQGARSGWIFLLTGIMISQIIFFRKEMFSAQHRRAENPFANRNLAVRPASPRLPSTATGGAESTSGSCRSRVRKVLQKSPKGESGLAGWRCSSHSILSGNRRHDHRKIVRPVKQRFALGKPALASAPSQRLSAALRASCGIETG